MIASFRAHHARHACLGAVLGAVLAPPSAAQPYAFVNDHTNSFTPASLTVVDTATGRVVWSLPRRIGRGALGIAVHPLGTAVYVACVYSQEVTVVDPRLRAVVARVRVGPRMGWGVAVAPDGETVYVAGSSTGRGVQAISTATNRVVATLPTGVGPLGVAIAPDGTELYTADSDGGTVSIVDLTRRTLRATIRVGARPTSVAVSPDGSRVWVTSQRSNTVTAIDPRSARVVATVSGIPAPVAVTVHPAGTDVYVTNEQPAGILAVIDPATARIRKTINVGNAPLGVTVHPWGHHVYVAVRNSNQLLAFDTRTHALVRRIPIRAPHAFGRFMIPSSAYVPFGSGCRSTGGVPRLRGAQWPRLARSFALEMTSLPRSRAGVVLTGTSLTQWSGLRLPFDLRPLGAPGCVVRVSGDVDSPFSTGSSTRVRWGFTLPASPQLLGQAFYNQAAVIDPGSNALGIVVSNAAARVGL